jgi:hypothetical protein
MKHAILVVLVLLGSSAAAFAQNDARWVQPYPQVASYWELVGHLFGPGSALVEDERLKPITDLAVLEVGTIEARTPVGETVAAFATITYNGGSDNLSELSDPHLVIKDLTQVRVSKAGTLGLTVSVRTASSSDGHMQCIYQLLKNCAFLADGLSRAIVACDKAAFWSSWQTQPQRLPFAGTFVVDGSSVLDISFDEATDEVLTALRTPATPPPAPTQPGFRIR